MDLTAENHFIRSLLLSALSVLGTACARRASSPPSKPAVSVVGLYARPVSLTTQLREVSDALRARGKYVEQRQAQEALVTDDAEAFRLAQMRLRSGVDSYLATLDAERSLYSAQQELASVPQSELANRVV
jgi:hypothetical protein